MILLGVLLLWRALRSLPGTAKTRRRCSLERPLSTPRTIRCGRTFRSIWKPPLDLLGPVSTQDSPVVHSAGGGTVVSSQALSTPASIDAEVASLAQALGDGAASSGESETAKVLRIFAWVRNNIDYDAYYGMRKGSALPC